MTMTPARFPRIRAALCAWIAAWEGEAQAGLLDGLETTIAASHSDAFAFAVSQELDGHQVFVMLSASLETWPLRDLIVHLLDTMGHQRRELLIEAGRADALKAIAGRIAGG